MKLPWIETGGFYAREVIGFLDAGPGYLVEREQSASEALELCALFVEMAQEYGLAVLGLWRYWLHELV